MSNSKGRRLSPTGRRRAEFREDLLAILDGGQLDAFLVLVEDLAGTHDATELALKTRQIREAEGKGKA